jgi:CheY-like chemotaxis protein
MAPKPQTLGSPPRSRGAPRFGLCHNRIRVPKCILVVDDLPYLREVQVLLLKEAGYTATALGNAREALAQLPDIAPDLILLDVAMPGMDGRQFLSELRAAPRWRDVPVILTTGRQADEVAEDTGCEVLAKPFTESALLDIVRRVLGETTPPEPPARR